jgi:glycogen operon protein
MRSGVTDCCDGFNFAVFSRHAERVDLLLFEDATDVEPMLIRSSPPLDDSIPCASTGWR